MTLVIENGTGVAGANSYANLDAIREYAARRGVTLDENDAILEPLAYKAMDYLESKRLGLLSLSWPSRNGHVCGLSQAQALIRLSNAQAQLCIEQSSGVDLAPTRKDAFVLRETVGPISTRYSERYGPSAGVSPSMPAIQAILGPLLNCGHGMFNTIRV